MGWQKWSWCSRCGCGPTSGAGGSTSSVGGSTSGVGGSTSGVGGPTREGPPAPVFTRSPWARALNPLQERMALAAPPSAAGLELRDFLLEAEQTLQVMWDLVSVYAACPSSWSYTGCTQKELKQDVQSVPARSLPSLAVSTVGQAHPPTPPAASRGLWKTLPTGED